MKKLLNLLLVTAIMATSGMACGEQGYQYYGIPQWQAFSFPQQRYVMPQYQFAMPLQPYAPSPYLCIQNKDAIYCCVAAVVCGAAILSMTISKSKDTGAKNRTGIMKLAESGINLFGLSCCGSSSSGDNSAGSIVTTAPAVPNTEPDTNDYTSITDVDYTSDVSNMRNATSASDELINSTSLGLKATEILNHYNSQKISTGTLSNVDDLTAKLTIDEYIDNESGVEPVIINVDSVIGLRAMSAPNCNFYKATVTKSLYSNTYNIKFATTGHGFSDATTVLCGLWSDLVKFYTNPLPNSEKSAL